MTSLRGQSDLKRAKLIRAGVQPFAFLGTIAVLPSWPRAFPNANRQKASALFVAPGAGVFVSRHQMVELERPFCGVRLSWRKAFSEARVGCAALNGPEVHFGPERGASGWRSGSRLPLRPSRMNIL